MTSRRAVTISKHGDHPLPVPVAGLHHAHGRNRFPVSRWDFPRGTSVPSALILLLRSSEEPGSICSVTSFGWWKMQWCPLASGVNKLSLSCFSHIPCALLPSTSPALGGWHGLTGPSNLVWKPWWNHTETFWARLSIGLVHTRRI